MYAQDNNTLPVWIIVTSLLTCISINSQPFLVGIVSPTEENGKRHRAKVTRQVVEIIDQDNGQRIENINFILDIGNGKVEELISYNQLLEHLENAQDHDMGMDQDLYRFRAI